MNYSYTPDYLTRDNRPWFPVMGEIHYSRLPEAEWKDALLKMKAGGVTVASCYVIWIHHEEIEQAWDFSGQRNLRRFVETCQACGLSLMLRIGPWCHGEVRNGGFPDWLLKKDFVPRTNDERYFAQVDAYYRKIFEQVQGLMLGDGGPVIGVQIENEYGHVGGLTGEPGEAHMRRLAEMARGIGFDAPIYTATGWGGAVTGGLLPVMGGYCEAPWDQRLTEIEPSGNYVFTPERNDHNIGSDHRLGEGLTFDPAKFPFLTAELGGGLQVTLHRRPVATGKDTAAMSMVKLGSGVNLLGYYMYHGGANPEGKLTTLQESRATGYLNDLPVIAYDFRAPLGSYGQLHDAFHELRLLAMFCHDFGVQLCEMPPIFPADNPLDPADSTHLRYSFRVSAEGWGYAFVSNYVRHMKRPPFENVRLRVPGRDKTLPALSIAPDEFGFYPFDMPVHGGKIRFAKATPLCRIGTTTVLYGESIDAEDGADALLISREEAKHAYKVKLGQEHLLISSDPVLDDGGMLRVLASGDVALKAYPALPSAPEGFETTGTKGAFTCYRKVMPAKSAVCKIEKVAEGQYRLALAYPEDAYDYHLNLHYRANTGVAYVNGRAITDDFWADGTWCIGLKRHGFPDVVEISLEPLHKDTPVYLDAWPEMDGESVCALDEVIVQRIDDVPLRFQ